MAALSVAGGNSSSIHHGSSRALYARSEQVVLCRYMQGSSNQMLRQAIYKVHTVLRCCVNACCCKYCGVPCLYQAPPQAHTPPTTNLHQAVHLKVADVVYAAHAAICVGQALVMPPRVVTLQANSNRRKA